MLVTEALEFAIRRAREVKLGQVAGSLTFTTTLSIVPLMTVGFAILTTSPAFAHMQSSLHDMLLRNLMPGAISDNIFRYLNLFASKARGLTVVGLAFLGVTSVSMMLTIDQALNSIWRVRRSRPLSRRIFIYWSVLTLGPVLLGLSLSLSSYLESASEGLIERPTLAIALLIDLVPMVILAIGYAAMYVYVPNTVVRWRHAFVGASVAAVAFEIAKRGFAIYISRIPTYTAIYGALAALPIFLLWVYLSWYITLIGATIAANVPALLEGRWRETPAAGERFVDALRVLRSLLAARPGKLPGYYLRELCRDSGLSTERAVAVLECLEGAGIVLRSQLMTGKGPTKLLQDQLWILAATPDAIRISQVFHLFAFDGNVLARSAIPADDPMAPLLRATPEKSLGWTLANAFDLASECGA
jgi:membrane protein